MANNITPKLKAFVRIDGTGRVIPGAPIFQAQKPKVGNWREIPLYYRGDSTTTSTTTAGVVAYTITSGGYNNVSGACSNLGGGMLTTVYGLSTPLSVTAFYTDQALTTLFTGTQSSSNHYGFYINGFPGAKYTAVINDAGVVSGNVACVASTGYALFDGSSATVGGACALLNATTRNTVYAAESSIDSITRLYSDSQLTTPVVGVQTSYQCLAVLGNSPMDPTTNGHAVIIATNGNITSSVTCPAPTTTSTTTTAAPGVTTYGVSPTGYADRPTACAASFTPFAVYAASSNPASVTQFFNDSGLTVPYTGDDTSYYTYFVQSNPSVKYTANISSTIGEVLSKAAC
jgi:hypothetical protein